MAQQDELINQKRAEKDKLIKHKRSVREGGMSNTAGGGQTRRGELSEKIAEVKAVKKAKREANDQMRDLVAQIDGFETEKRQL